MPTKRRPLKHGPRVGEVRVTSKILDLYRAYQDEVRQHDRYTRQAGKLHSGLQTALNHLPWEDVYEHDLQFNQLHLLAYPDLKTRPVRLAKTSGHNPLIADYERALSASVARHSPKSRV